MDPVFGRIAAFLHLLIYVLIRWPHGNRNKILKVAESHIGLIEVLLLIAALIGTTIFPIIWIIAGFPRFADYPMHPVALGIGVLASVIGNWLFYRSHADLGLLWSVTLQLREDHQLVTSGLYRKIRHPMYTAMFVQGIAQALLIPNLIVGPAWLLTFGLLYLVRVGREERMMLDRFGSEYQTYMRKTGRLLPRTGTQLTPDPTADIEVS